MKNSTLKSMFNKIANNKFTLYIVAFIAFFSLYNHIMNSQFSAVLLFFLTGAIAYNFTKNMTLVLGISFLMTTLASMSNNLFGLQEGFEDESNSNNDISNNIELDEMQDIEEETEETEENMEKFKNKKTKKSGYQNQLKLNPSLYNMPNKDQMLIQLGKATEMEQAYDNLESIIGKDNIQSVSSDTKDLIKQQNELIKQLKTMTPALNDAMGSLGKLDIGKLSNMFTSATKNLSELK